MSFAARIQDLRKDYVVGGEMVHALRGVSLDVPAGDYVAIMGPSGSGKSTLLNLLGCLDRPTSGNYFLANENVAKLSDDRLSEVRLHYRGNVTAADRKRVQDLAEMVGLGGRLKHRPMQLSGGQQQRVAIARSLVNDPVFLLADEPTGNLDSHTTEEILALLERLNDAGKTIIMVTHEPDVAERAKRIVRLRDGVVQFDRKTARAGGSSAEEVEIASTTAARPA
jgi:putative ABC transport system ATP-binding protein